MGPKCTTPFFQKCTVVPLSPNGKNIIGKRKQNTFCNSDKKEEEWQLSTDTLNGFIQKSNATTQNLITMDKDWDESELSMEFRDMEKQMKALNDINMQSISES